FWLVLLISVLLSLAGMAGDLSASVIKRNYGEKDFGAFFPGHGGVMDRFDSTLFVLPCLYALVRLAGKT
ncbi:MAG TPA: phosphatidate cytidylyltransferase, partial [Clostridiales bacterium]|nr:phosphatidate cytidylyltransferase [Clostridiales bacterium]